MVPSLNSRKKKIDRKTIKGFEENNGFIVEKSLIFGTGILPVKKNYGQNALI